MADSKDGPMVAGEQAHTPGPWRLVVGDDYHVQADVYPTDCPHCCKSVDNGPHLATVYVATAGNRPDDFGLANARLIAAAPEMRDILTKLVEIYGDMQDGDGNMPAEIMQARAVLAKAEGRPNV